MNHKSKKKRGTIKTRLDALLLQLGMAENIQQAQAFIMAGKVICDNQRVDKPGILVALDATLRVRGLKKYVSRGGDKLARSIISVGLSGHHFEGLHLLDVGSSTGGFSDCALQWGAASVTCVDVGTNQLHWQLRQDPRVYLYENQDIRSFDASKIATLPRYDWIISDVSFISLTTIAEAIVKNAAAHTQLLLLVKPQFELAKECVPAGGVVKDKAHVRAALNRVQDCFLELGWRTVVCVKSAVLGRDGNQ
ncbi:MAG: TlyA family RNA methyltransferase, partial [Zetaproteobacteria bacterium]|nr:TlyA family RNA methyltransferase [Zetaproteobacteria bacterium]